MILSNSSPPPTLNASYICHNSHHILSGVIISCCVYRPLTKANILFEYKDDVIPRLVCCVELDQVGVVQVIHDLDLILHHLLPQTGRHNERWPELTTTVLQQHPIMFERLYCLTFSLRLLALMTFAAKVRPEEFSTHLCTWPKRPLIDERGKEKETGITPLSSHITSWKHAWECRTWTFMFQSQIKKWSLFQLRRFTVLCVLNAVFH